MSKVYLKKIEIENDECVLLNFGMPGRLECYFFDREHCMEMCCNGFIYIPATPEEIERYKQRHGE